MISLTLIAHRMRTACVALLSVCLVVNSPLLSNASAPAARTVTSNDGAFSIVLGDDWRLIENAVDLRASAARTRMTFVGTSSADTAEFDTEAYARTIFERTQTRGNVLVRIGPAMAATVLPGIPMLRRDAIYKDKAGNEFRLRIFVTVYGFRTYIFVFTTDDLDAAANPDDPEDDDAPGDALLGTLRLNLRVGTFKTAETLVLHRPTSKAREGFASSDLDPVNADENSLASLQFSGLVRMNAAYQIEPDLAESWQISPDGRVYTFTLRARGVFSNRAPITVDDVLASWERAAHQTRSFVTSPFAQFKDGDWLKRHPISDLSSVRRISRNTLRIALEQPSQDFLARLTMTVAAVLPKRSIDGLTRLTPQQLIKIPASGPFMQDAQPGLASSYRLITFKRNPNYHQPAKIANIVFLSDLSGALGGLYQDGVFDIVALDENEATVFRADGNPFAPDVQSFSTPCAQMLRLDSKREPLDSIFVRRALAQTIDWQALSDAYETKLNSAVWSILPPGVAGYRERARTPLFDPAAARKSLEKSVYAKQLPTITMTLYSTTADRSQLIEVIAEMWRKHLGAAVHIDYIGNSESRNYVDNLAAGSAQILWDGTCPEIPDALPFLDVPFRSSSNGNVNGFRDTRFDLLLDRASRAGDAQERIALYQEAEDLIFGDVLAIPIPHVASHVAIRPRVQGYVPSARLLTQLHRLALDAPAGQNR
jgi:oligopeptide transport system substrate-binding protein